jgi:serine/threonine protein kinase
VGGHEPTRTDGDVEPQPEGGHLVDGRDARLHGEILFEIGYNKDCDWWSLGVVVYEMLVGYPPFYGDDPLVTCRKILCFKETLQFPPEAPLSPHAESLIRSLLCDREERLGKEGADQIKRHPFFDGIDWSSLREPGAAPFKPQVDSATDTSHFDTFEELPVQAIPVVLRQRAERHQRDGRWRAGRGAAAAGKI